MYKLSVPVFIDKYNENKNVYLEELKKAKAERIFLCGPMIDLLKEDLFDEATISIVRNTVTELKNEGYEVGFWVIGFGHGAPLVGCVPKSGSYTRITGSDGKQTDAICPLDDNFKKDYARGLLQLATLNPDIIMIDDDLRLNLRGYDLGCCCDLHMSEFKKRLGEDIKREDVVKKVMSGKRSLYRDVWLELMRDSMIVFCKYLRFELDKVAPNIPMCACSCYDTWGICGFDAIEIANILSGSGNKKTLRTIGAPYHYGSRNFQRGVERTRMQAEWCRNYDIEIFSEGDVYPRPRYETPSRTLEMFDIALRCSHATNGILKYMYDYVNDVEFEKGYVERHAKNEKLRDDLSTIFDDKKPIGIRVFEDNNKIRNWELPKEISSNILKYLFVDDFGGRAAEILTHNAIPTVYDNSGEYPIAVFGENAKYITEGDLKYGAFIDAKAALILKGRGIDTGIISYEESEFQEEEFISEYISTAKYGKLSMNKMIVSEKADILSWLKPGNYPGAYTYENKNGQRFYCIALGEYTVANNVYLLHYMLQEQRINALEWLGGKELPIVCKKNPHLYSLVSKNKSTDGMAVLLINNFMDEIPCPKITLDKEYDKIRFVNCAGQMNGREVVLSEICPYGIAAFEVN